MSVLVDKVEWCRYKGKRPVGETTQVLGGEKELLMEGPTGRPLQKAGDAKVKMCSVPVG